jgi:hypothetical protein
LFGSACGLPHDSLEISIYRHRHASRLRDKDPQRLHPKAGCLIPATDEDMLPFVPMNAIRLGGSKKDKRVVSLWGSVGLLRKAVNRASL